MAKMRRKRTAGKKLALVTGSGTGIGRMVALESARAGAAVALQRYERRDDYAT